jgi:hypothetical protein
MKLRVESCDGHFEVTGGITSLDRHEDFYPSFTGFRHKRPQAFLKKNNPVSCIK